MTVREAYLTAAGSAADLIDQPAVTAAWARPSALTGFTVGGLAEHLAFQVVFAVETLRRPAPTGEVVSLLGHYGKVSWIGADIDAEANVAIRRGGETAAAEGPAALTARVSAAVRELCDLVPKEPADRLVHPPSGPWRLRLDDFLVTRMMEIAVHSDDLAASVGIATPDLPDAVLDPVFGLLTRLSIRRHGSVALLRALSRAERAPSSVTAF
jgi:Mycothiol maleylpyruvate isomerase N-terminal domain